MYLKLDFYLLLMDIKSIVSFAIGCFFLVWLIIFSIPITTFTEEMTETLEECRDRIVDEIPSLINDTDNLDKTLDEYCNPQKGGFANISKFANWLNKNIVAWIFVSFFITLAFFIVLLFAIGLIVWILFIIQASENSGFSQSI
jgi:predicted PurR-regulated permease PerM